MFVSSVTAVAVAVNSPDVSSAVVGLAINYTLLIPTYLVWVVRSLSDVEMYMCAVERVEKYGRLKAEEYRQNKIGEDRDARRTGDGMRTGEERLRGGSGN